MATDNPTMTCEARRQALAGLPDPRRLPADLRSHLTACPGCARFRRGLVALDRLVPQVAVPASPPHVREDFLANLPAESGLPPIIVRRPAAKRDSSIALTAVRGVWAAREQWQYAAGVAAMLTFGVGLWWLSTGARPAQAEVAKLRHELLAKEMKHLAALTRAETPAAKVAVWSRMAADFSAETKLVYKTDAGPEMASLEAMYTKAVRQGVLAQAKQLLPMLNGAERETALAPAVAQLRATEAEAAALAGVAPPASRVPLLNIAGIAKSAREDLQKLVTGGA